MKNDKLKLTIPWEEIDEQAQKKIQSALEIKSLKKLAIMPDVHGFYDLPIGSVALLDGQIWPGAVGYDIGCGMCHINTKTDIRNIPSLEDVFKNVKKYIPVGFTENDKPRTDVDKFPNASKIAAIQDAVRYKASMQLGTLGGGNHFIEIGLNSLNQIGITIHSGSRRPGWLIADYWMRVSNGPVDINSEIGKAYYTDMQWALNFALMNRKIMMQKCLNALHLGKIDNYEMVNENHNHATITKDGVIHRKGATPAEIGQVGIIPINMRDGVYITNGLGNEEYLSSASHGAGRVMSRKKARETFNLEQLENEMCHIITPELDNLLDEAPESYKDESYVIGKQKGVTISIRDHFEPVVVLKG